MTRISCVLINKDAALYSIAYPKAALSDMMRMDPLFRSKSGIRSTDFSRPFNKLHLFYLPELVQQGTSYQNYLAAYQ